MAASRHPDHRPEVTSAYSQPCGTHWRFSAVGFAVRSGMRGVPPRRKRQAQEIRDNRAIVTKNLPIFEKSSRIGVKPI
jgi:hypothetical protein